MDFIEINKKEIENWLSGSFSWKVVQLNQCQRLE